MPYWEDRVQTLLEAQQLLFPGMSTRRGEKTRAEKQHTPKSYKPFKAEGGPIKPGDVKKGDRVSIGTEHAFRDPRVRNPKQQVFYAPHGLGTARGPNQDRLDLEVLQAGAKAIKVSTPTSFRHVNSHATMTFRYLDGLYRWGGPTSTIVLVKVGSTIPKEPKVTYHYYAIEGVSGYRVDVPFEGERVVDVREAYSTMHNTKLRNIAVQLPGLAKPIGAIYRWRWELSPEERRKYPKLVAISEKIAKRVAAEQEKREEPFYRENPYLRKMSRAVKW